MNRSVLKLLLVVLLFLSAAGLFMDSITFALYAADPRSGRDRACYTRLEILLGVKQPTGWIRPTELVGSGILAAAGIAVMVRRMRSE